MKKHTAKHLIVLCVCFCILLALGIFSASRVEAATVDYGFSVNGQQITSAHLSGKGYSYDAASNTLTLNKDFSLAITYSADNSVRSDWRGTTNRKYVPCIDLKELRNIDIVLDGVVRIADSGSQYVYKDGDISYHTYGIYGEDCNITFKSGGSGRGMLIIDTTDTAIYCHGMDADGIDMSLTSFGTSAIYSTNGVAFLNGTKATVTTESLGSIYQTWSNGSQSQNVSNGTFRFDSIATIYARSPSWQGNAILVMSGSTLDVYAGIVDVIDVRNDFRDESANTSMKDDFARVPYGDTWATTSSIDQRLYCGIWANESTVYVDQATLNVHTNSYTSRIRNALGTYSRGYLWRTVGVNSFGVFACNANINVEMLGEDDILAVGDDVHAFYEVSYNTLYGDKIQNYDKGVTSFDMYGVTNISSLIEQRYSKDATTHARFANDSCMWYAFDWENTSKFREHGNQTSDSIIKPHASHWAGEVYSIKYEYTTLPESGLCLYRSIDSYYKDSTVYLRKNGTDYQYSKYYDFRDATTLSGKLFDAEALGWDKDIEVISGDFEIKLSRAADMTLNVRDGATAKLMLDGGIEAPYTGTYRINTAGNVTIEGDYYANEMYFDGLNYDTSDIEGVHGDVLKAGGSVTISSGTIASATPTYVNGLGFAVTLSMNGGNINLINDRDDYYFNGHSAEKYTVSLGDYASIFDWHKLTHSSVLSTTGIYPIDGKLYYYKNLDFSGVVFNTNPITFHHFTWYDESLGYDTYYFPQAAEDGYTVYRLQEHDIYQKASNAQHYINDGTKNYTFDSFVYYKAYYMPGNNPFLLDEDNLTVTEIGGTRSRTAPDSATVVWGRYDSTGAFSQLNESGSKALSLTMDISYSMNDYSGYFCTVTDAEGNEHTLNYEINVIRFGTPNDQYVGSGETANFSCSYEAVGDWTNGFTWKWEYRVNDSAEWQTLSGSSGNSCTFTAFYNSADSNSHGYQFRLVGTMTYIAAIGSGGISTVYELCSEPATLYMGAKVVESPATAEVQINDPHDTFIITVKYQRAREAVFQKLVGDAYQNAEGVTMTTSTADDGVVTLNLIFAKSYYSDADGNWDSTKLDGTYRLWLKGCQVEGKTEYYNDAYAEISASVAPAPVFTGTKDSLVAVPGENIYYTVGFENLDDSDPVWWEYSLDGGKTWVKLTETDDTKPLYIYVFRGITISSTTGTSQRFGANSTIYFNPATLVQDGMLVRCVMQDECGIYYSDAAASTKLTVIGFPSFDKQPKDQLLNETKHTTAEIFYTLSGEIPSDVTVTSQWQKYVGSTWTNITTNDLYECGDQKLTFKDISALDNRAQYRCKLSLAKDGVTRDITTDAATVCVAHLPEFTGAPTANATEYWAGDEFKLSASWDAPKSSAEWQVCKDGTNWVEYVSPVVHPVDSWSTDATDSWFKINSITAEMDGWQFRMSVEYSAGTLELGYETCTAYSDVYTLHVYSGNCDIESDIQKAVDKGYTTIKLVDNITLSKTWVIDRDMTLDLNGHILQGDGTEYNLIKVTNNATLTIIDSDPNADASYGGAAVPFKGGSIRNSGDTALLVDTGTILFNAGTIYQCLGAQSSIAAAFDVRASDDYESRLVIDGGQIIDCGSNAQSAIMAVATVKKDAYAIFKSGKIDSCKGGAIGTLGGIIEMSGGTISNCGNGAIAGLFAERVTVTGGLIENCRVSNNGGAIAVSSSIVEVSNVTINGCTASGTDGKYGMGGAIYVQASDNCTFGYGIVIKNCQAKTGGAIYVEKFELWPASDVAFKDIQISGCSAADDVIVHVDTAIYADGGKIEGKVVANGGIKKTDPTHADTTEFFGDVISGGADSEPITAGMYYAGVTGISEDDTIVTVTFKNGGETHAVLVMQKGTVAVPAETPKDFRTFIGWYNGDMLYLFDKAVDEDIVLEARWAVDTTSVDDLTEYLEQLEQELREALEGKADAEEIQKAVDDLEKAIEELKAAKDDYKDADKALEDKLLDAIENAQNAAIEAAQKLVEEAQKELRDAIDQKADADTVNAELEKLKAAIAILESAKDNYKDADKELEAKLTAAIEAAQKAAVEAAQQLVEEAQKELQEAIDKKADADAVNAELEKLKKAIEALEAIKDDYKLADKALEDKLTAAIEAAQKSAVEAAQKLVEDATKALQDAIDQKADADTVNAELEKLKKAIAALEAVKDDYKAADKQLEDKLDSAIEAAQKAALEAAQKYVDDAAKELEDAIDKKADADTVNAELEKLKNAIAALEAAKDNFKSDDKQLEDKLDKAIDKAKDSAVDAAKKLVDDATNELRDAITNGDKSLEEQIKKMNQTLETVRTTLEYTSETDKLELQNKIKEAESALIAAIEELDDRLTAAEDKLDRIEAEMQEKHDSLILIIVIAIVAFAAVDVAIIAAWLTWKRKKNL